MKKIGLAVAAAALVTASAAVAAPPPNANANQNATVKTCKNTKARMGASSFNAVFAPKTRNARAALRNCARREAAAQRQERRNAAQTCRAWQSDPAAFEAAMAGTPNAGKTFAEVFGPGRNAFGKCVSTVARQQGRERRADLVNAAKTCKAWRADPAAFEAAMAGTPNAGKTFAEVFGPGRNAYGKCVSTVARANASQD